MALKAGTVLEFEKDTMARAIENAFEIEMEKHFPKILLPEDMRVYWRILCVAVAQGVIRHLTEQVGDAFKIDVEVRQVIDDSAEDGVPKPALESRNPERISVRGYSTNFGNFIRAEDEADSGRPGEPAVFVQVPDRDNRIWSEGGTSVDEGGGTVVEVQYEGELYKDKDAP